MSRHANCKLPANNQPKRTIRIPSLPSGIVGQVRKVSTEISEMQKNMVMESEARIQLQITVEQLKAETAEAKLFMAEIVKDVGVNRVCNGNETLNLLIKTMPCKSLHELDLLLGYIESRSLQWVCIEAVDWGL